MKEHKKNEWIDGEGVCEALIGHCPVYAAPQLVYTFLEASGRQGWQGRSGCSLIGQVCLNNLSEKRPLFLRLSV
jgi:hypothetical protein